MNYLTRKQINQLRTLKVLFLIQVFVSVLILSFTYYCEGVGEVMGIICFSLVSILFYVMEREMLREINKNSKNNKTKGV